MDHLKIFIISWAGQHERAAAIYDALHRYGPAVLIVYSDPEPTPPFKEGVAAIRRPNALFWADKFQACVERAGNEPMLVLHADCACDDWNGVVERAIVAMSGPAPIGAWSPQVVSGMHFPLERVHIAALDGTPMSVVTRIDGLVFALSPPVISRMRQASYNGNVYGLGIGWMFCSFCHATHRLVVIDRSIQVRHALTRGYPIKDAVQQMHGFLRQLRTEEIIQFILISHYTAPPPPGEAVMRPR